MLKTSKIFKIHVFIPGWSCTSAFGSGGITSQRPSSTLKSWVTGQRRRVMFLDGLQAPLMHYMRHRRTTSLPCWRMQTSLQSTQNVSQFSQGISSWLTGFVVTRIGTRCLTQDNFMGGSIIFYFLMPIFWSVNIFQGVLFMNCFCKKGWA